MTQIQSLRNAAILLVEDDESLKGLLRKYLDRHECRVLEADNGEDAWRLYQEHPVDIIISDWMMPRLDGRELLRRVKSSRRGDTVPFLFLTARDSIEDLVDGLASGASEYITKPFHMTELLARIQTLLRMKYLQDDVRREKARLEEELAFAQRVQAALLARHSPVPETIELRTHYQPSGFVGGDFFDLIALGEGHYGVFLGDVTGRGPAAALISSLVKGFLSRSAPGLYEPARVLQGLNDHLVEVLDPQMYVSAFYGVYHVGRRTFRYSNGGQHRQLLLSASREPSPLYIEGVLVGLFPGESFRTAEVALAKGDRILLFTDGLYEAQGIHGEEAGFEWVCRAAREHAADSLDRFLASFLPPPPTPSPAGEGSGPFLGDDLLAVALEVK